MRTVTWGDVRWQVEDISIPALPDYHFWDHWENGEFEPETLQIVDRFVTPGSTFCDIGAWLGNVSLWAERLGAHVIAVEPDPVAAKVLHRNVAMNHGDVLVFEGAVNNTTGMCFIEPHSDGWGSSMTHLAEDGLEVPCLTLPDLFDVYDVENCSLVKMDCEGAESIILEHAAPFLAEMKVPLLVAMHEPWWDKPVERKWFDGYRSIEGTIGGWGHVLALP